MECHDKTRFFYTVTFSLFLSTKTKTNVKVKCKLCFGAKVLSTANNSNPKLLKNLEKQPTLMKLTAVAIEDLVYTSEVSQVTPLMQQQLDLNQRTASQGQLDNVTAWSVLENMLPVSTAKLGGGEKDDKLNLCWGVWEHTPTQMLF